LKKLHPNTYSPRLCSIEKQQKRYSNTMNPVQFKPHIKTLKQTLTLCLLEGEWFIEEGN